MAGAWATVANLRRVQQLLNNPYYNDGRVIPALIAKQIEAELTTYTNPHSLPLVDPNTDYIKDSAESSALASDLNDISMAANSAISAEGERAEAAAKWHRGGLTETSNMSSLSNGIYNVSSASVATALGIPGNAAGGLTNFEFGSLGYRIYRTAEVVQRTYAQAKTSAGWQPWGSVDFDWYKGSAASTVAAPLNNPDTFPMGSVTVSTGSTADALGLPESSAGVVQTWEWGALNWKLQVFLTQTGNMWMRPNAGTWAGWNNATADPPPVASTGSRSSSGMKVIPLALTLGQGDMDAPLSRQYRIPLDFAAPVTRWRLHITDKNVHTGAHRGSGINIHDVYVGPHAGNGVYSATPTRVGGGFDLSAQPDGSWVSSWRTEKISEAPSLISYAYTATTAPQLGVCGGWNTSNLDTVGALEGLNQGLQKWVAFDMWIEAETYAGTPVIAVFGDSLASGAQATIPRLESVVEQYARSRKALPVHYAVSGNAMQDFAAAPSAYKFARWSHLDPADGVLWSMGHNDVYRGRSFAQMRADFDTLYPYITSRVAPVVVCATVTTRNAPTNPDMHLVRDQWNAWLAQQKANAQVDGRIRDVYDFHAVTDNGDTIKPEYNVDDIHINTAGYTAQKNAITRAFVSPPLMYAAL